MANQRITELSTAGTLDLTELLALVQGGSTKKITLQNLLNAKVECLAFALSDEVTSITAGTNKIKFRMPYGMVLTSVRASVGTEQSSGSLLTVDINKNGTTILSTKLTIDNNERTSTTAATAPVISDSALTDDAEISMDVDQVGSSPKGLKVYLIGTRA